MPQLKKHTDISGRILGLITIFCGLILLGLVFWLSYLFFRTPIPGLEQAGFKNLTPANINLGASLAVFASRLLILGLMALVASLVANHGIKIYFAAGYMPESSHNKEDR